ncbi:hypothetical protein, partial [Caballeronia ptereochthonis]|uniref:hypothetical protein n=1 Tax=Caballeronia ptereochthonis TaxID=1777144 RepID=UPI001ABFCC76
IVRISRVKVGNRQAPHASRKNPTPKGGVFALARAKMRFSNGVCQTRTVQALIFPFVNPHGTCH